MKLPEPHFDPVSHGTCEVRKCSSPAKFRASWAQGTIEKLVCAAHKQQLEDMVFGELDPSLFASNSRFR